MNKYNHHESEADLYDLLTEDRTPDSYLLLFNEFDDPDNGLLRDKIYLALSGEWIELKISYTNAKEVSFVDLSPTVARKLASLLVELADKIDDTD